MLQNAKIYILKKDLPNASAWTYVQVVLVGKGEHLVYTCGSKRGRTDKKRKFLFRFIEENEKHFLEWFEYGPVKVSEEKNFYMVSVLGGNAPAHKHFKLSEAKEEAIRLAKLTNRDVFVLLTQKKYRYKNGLVQETIYKTHI